MSHFTDAELAAYIAESLPIARSTAVEEALRTSEAVRNRFRALLADGEPGTLSVGALWRQQRVSCPSRSTWAAFLAGDLGGGMAEYLRFHLDDIGCRFCAANLADLQASDPDAERRARKYFETSVGRLSQVAADGTP